MEKRKWPWKKKPSERSPGESESAGSFSSHSERYSDEQEVLRESPADSSQSPEVNSKASSMDDEVKESLKSLTEKLSAALVNVSAKEDLVKQHAKVAEEAVAGWEKAENEVAALKQQLEAALQQNLNLEVRASHLDGALKECVRQLRQSKDEHEKQISDAIQEKKNEWGYEKSQLEKQIIDLQAQKNSRSVDPNTLLILESLKRENSSLKQELASHFKDLEVMIIERDLSTRAAENASKLQLESIKRIAKLEADCRRLQSVARKSTSVNNHMHFGASSFYADSLTDSCKSSNTGSEQNYSELDQFKSEKSCPRNFSVEIDMMDDFLEMERLAASSETEKSNTPFSVVSALVDNSSRDEFDIMARRVDDLENKLRNIEKEKSEVQNAFNGSLDSLKAAESKMAEGEMKLEEMEKELRTVNETKEMLEFQLVGMEAEVRTLSANVESLKAEFEEERKLSAELIVKCRELESELNRRIHESELQESINLNVEQIKQEDLAVAADKLAECQKTIATLGRQLESLARLEDFFMDTPDIPDLCKVSGTGGELWMSPSKDTTLAKSGLDRPRMSVEINGDHLAGRDDDSIQTSMACHLSGAKSRNGFGKFFSRSTSVIELGNTRE